MNSLDFIFLQMDQTRLAIRFGFVFLIVFMWLLLEQFDIMMSLLDGKHLNQAQPAQNADLFRSRLHIYMNDLAEQKGPLGCIRNLL